MDLRAQIEAEALAAKRAVPLLTDDAVAAALAQAAALVRDRRDAILTANREDVETASGLDEGTLDRLRLDERRVESLARQVASLAGLEPIPREADAWTLPNGLRV